jgi:hypothetical protein
MEIPNCQTSLMNKCMQSNANYSTEGMEKWKKKIIPIEMQNLEG